MAKTKKAISPREALKQILDNAKTLSTRRIMLNEAFGYVLAKNLESKINVPPFDNSAMDGFAIHKADLSSQQPLQIIGEIKAGAQPEMAVEPGSAISIMTGAPIPEGAASVIRVENTQIRGQRLEIRGQVKKGANIRLAGEDIKKGSTILTAGTILKPIHLGLAASVGVHDLSVFNKPKVAVIITGDEIVKPGRPLSKGQIYESNSFLLNGLLRQARAELVFNVKVRDILSHTIDTLSRAALKADVVLTTGGISVGKYDLVAIALQKLGAKPFFEKVAQKPGKPLSFFMLNNKSVISLPGNPVAVAISFELHVRPLLLKMAGAKDIFRKEIKALLDEPIKKKRSRVTYIRVFLKEKNGRTFAKPTGAQGSGVLTSMISDGIAILPKETEYLEKGQEVKVIDLQGDYQ